MVLAVLPVMICALAMCDLGCLVSFNMDWTITCMFDYLTCLGLSNADIACVWNGTQSGGNFKNLKFFIKIQQIF